MILKFDCQSIFLVSLNSWAFDQLLVGYVTWSSNVRLRTRQAICLLISIDSPDISSKSIGWTSQIAIEGCSTQKEMQSEVFKTILSASEKLRSVAWRINTALESSAELRVELS